MSRSALSASSTSSTIRALAGALSCAGVALALLPPSRLGAQATATAARKAPVTKTSSRTDTIAYRVAMPDPSSHLFEVQIEFAPRAETVRMQMPVWSPGRYANMGFARNVQAVRVTDDADRPLAWSKESGSVWRVATRGARKVRVAYRVFANNLSGTFSQLDSTHANWNGASLFMYVDGRKPDPVHLSIVAPADWQVMSGAADSPAQREFRFRNYDEFIDTSTEVSNAFTVDSFRADGVLYRVMVHYSGTPPAGVRERFVRDVQRIVESENRVIAPPPIARYTFLFHVASNGGDGMEHLTSTQIMNPAPWRSDDVVLSAIGTASHEYFHTWNVKRIRPAALGPFDYSREQYQPSLWVAEGWTNYYGAMTLGRAGIIDRPTLLANTARTLRSVNESPGRKERSARMASFDAPFFDGAATPNLTNAPATFVSYYTRGQVLSMALDLMIRAKTSNERSLDDVLRRLKQLSWDTPNASYYLQGRGYTEADVERAASDVMGENMHPWFERHVGGVEDPDWVSLFAGAGLRLQIGGPSREYTLTEIPDATAAQAKVREGWYTGQSGRKM